MTVFMPVSASARAACCISSTCIAVPVLFGLTTNGIGPGLGRSARTRLRRLDPQSGREQIDTRGIASRPVEAGHKAESDRIVATAEHNGNGRGGVLGSHGRRPVGGDDYSHLPPYQFRCELRQLIVAASRGITHQPIQARAAAHTAVRTGIGYLTTL